MGYGFKHLGLKKNGVLYGFQQKSTGNGDEGRVKEVKEKVRMTIIGFLLSKTRTELSTLR